MRRVLIGSALVLLALSAWAIVTLPALAQSSPAGLALSPDQLAKLDKALADFGTDSTIGPNSGKALGLFQNDTTLNVRELVSKPDSAGTAHVFIKLPNSGNILLLSRSSVGDVSEYLLDINQQLVAAITYPAGASISSVPSEDARRQLIGEIAFWRNTADHL